MREPDERTKTKERTNERMNERKKVSATKINSADPAPKLRQQLQHK